MSMDIQWVLNSRGGMEYILPQTMIFLGREECDVTLQSRSVDKRHAVITYDHYEKCFKVKDLNSTNGTYVNDTRIPGQTYMKLEHMDSIRFGYDPHEFKIQRMHRVGEVTLSKRLSPEGIDGKVKESQQDTIPPPQPYSARQDAGDSAMPHSVGNSVDSSAVFGNKGVAQSETAVFNSNNLNQSNNHHKGYSGNSHCHQNRPPVESEETLPSIETVDCSSSSSEVSVPFLPVVNSAGGSVIAGLDTKLDSSEGSTQVPILCSAKHILESTSSNASLHSAFSGDSLDQLNESTSGVGSDQTLEGGGSSSALSTSVLSATEGDQVSSKVATNDEGRSEKSFSLSKGGREECIFQDISSGHFPPPQQQSPSVDRSTAGVDEENSKEKQKAAATAFTIEFDSVKTSSRKLDIKDSISKFAPPKIENDRPPGHRRNLSLSKVDEQKVLFSLAIAGSTDENDQLTNACSSENSFDKKPLSCETSPHNEKPIYGISRTVHTVKRGYHSEGYFSSDQDDDMSAKSERFNMRTAKCLEKAKGKTTENGNVNSSAAFLINKMLSSNNNQDVTSSKHVSTETTTTTTTYKDTKNSSSIQPSTVYEQTIEDEKKIPNRPSILNIKSSLLEDCDFLSLSVQAELNNRNKKNIHGDESKDDVSESGTYTIEKESPNLELEEARRNIDRIFGVTLEEPEEAVISGPQVLPLDIRDMQRSPDSDSSKSKSDSIPKRGTPNFTKEWSVYERQHTSSPLMDKELHHKSTDFRNKKVYDESEQNSQSSGSQLSKTASPENLLRPRRKLPTPPVDKLPFSIAMSRNNESLNSDNSFYTCSDGLQNSTNQSYSDMSYDTEKLLKETETVVSAMEARMDHAKAAIKPSGSLESRDSGGESDVDTSTASCCADKKSHKQETNISKRLNNQLKAKYKALEEFRCSPPMVIDKRLTQATAASKGKSKSRNIALNQDHVGSDNVSECETASIASDISSSSDISGSSPRARRRNSDKVPPAMKFNRAFSLRRARLGYSSDSASEKPLPSSVVPQNAKSRNAESKRTETNKCRPSSSSPSISLSRSDGGRFSLRMGKVAKNPSSTGSGRSEGETSRKHKNSNASARSNSTMTAKEAEMKNWRRRKEYDPMKAAAEGRKKEAAKRAVDKPPAGRNTSPSGNFQRSASFHGTEGFHAHHNTYASEDDMTRSLEEEEIIKCTTEYKHGRMETIISREQSLSSSPQLKKSGYVDDYLADGYSQSQTDILRGSPPYIRANQMNSHRHKTKLEALDSLVITTIHQMSSKLCGHTENLIKKLKNQYKISAEKADSLEDLLELLGSPDTPTSPATRNMSRELAGILKNLKKMEKGLQAIDKLSREEMALVDCSCPSNKQNCNGLSD